jgi:hypothetical protein
MRLAALVTADTHEVWEFPIPGGLVLAVPDFDGLFLLNPSAGFIWSESRLGSAPELIAARLISAFDIPEDIALRDVSATLEHWSDTLLVERARHPAERPMPSEEARLSPHIGGTTFDYRLNGKHFRLILDSRELEAEIVPRLTQLAAVPAPPDFTVSLTTSANSIRLLRGSHCFATEETASAARAILLQEMVRLSRGECEWLALLHAGACGTGSRCVVFPAATNSGKTTLTAVLMQSGFAFYADDSVAIGKPIGIGGKAIGNYTLAIPPMPFGLAVREGSWPVLAARFPGFNALPVTERFGQQVRFLPPVPQSEPVPAAAMVFPLYDPASATSITPLNTLDALINLKESGFWVEHTRESIRTFLDWVESLPRYQMVYSDVEDAVSFVRDILSYRL